MIASERVPEGEPLYVGIGTPSRGVAGNLGKAAAARSVLGDRMVGRREVADRRVEGVRHKQAVYKGRETPKEI